MDERGITAVEGLELGHHTLSERPTGCTVILTRAGAVGGVDVRGSAPGTRETELLDPVRSPDTRVHAVVLSGGSAWGLAAADGVMRYLGERDIGYRVGNALVPIVPGAILFDLSLEDGTPVRPGADCGYAAAAAASGAAPAEGSVGAGAGATVGKLGGPRRAMKGGFGTASITLESGLTVGAAVAVNAVGDIVDPATGEVVAGVRTEDGRGLADARRLLRSGSVFTAPPPGTNTTIGVVATNAALTKAEVTKVAQMAQDGLARTIYPAHTTRDGDTVFSLATGAWDGTADVTLIGALAAEVMAEAILRAVRLAEGLPGIPSVSDLGR
ncbi:MAG TPA: P1 family peptidase [Longimicrobiales bacterium]|nr:P1 family peptidase [Longimicrobiales bacterium]